MQTFSEAFYPLSSSTGGIPVTLHDHFPIPVKRWGRTQVMVKDEKDILSRFESICSQSGPQLWHDAGALGHTTT